MSAWSRITNVFRRERLARDLDEELQSHIDEAVENGRDPAEVLQAFGSRLSIRDQSRDAVTAGPLDELRSDVAFSWRQLLKSKTTSAAAILPLGLAAGACTAAFRLVDAVLLKPLPIDRPERLRILVKHGMRPNGTASVSRTYNYPLFRQLREAVRPEAELIATSYTRSVDLTFKSDREMEKAYRQHVSGWMFDARIKLLMKQRLDFEPASTGASPMQRTYRQALVALSVLVVLVLLIARANVANLMTARASARAREMALRVAIGAGRRRLVQLMLIECLLLTLAATIVGGLIAWRSSPWIVGMIDLPQVQRDWRFPLTSVFWHSGWG